MGPGNSFVMFFDRLVLTAGAAAIQERVIAVPALDHTSSGRLVTFLVDNPVQKIILGRWMNK